MAWSPEAWKRLGALFLDARQRRGLSREKFVELADVDISMKTVQDAENGKYHTKIPAGVSKIAAAHGWSAESVRHVLDGGNPTVLRSEGADSPEPAPRAQPPREEPTLLDLLTRVHEFGRLAVSLGADGAVRDELDATAQRLVQSIPREPSKKEYRLAAYRPHAPGEGPADDDTERILRAMEEDE